MIPKLLIGFCIFSIAAIFLSTANAELTAEVEPYSVNRTITIPFPIVEEDCKLFIDGLQPLQQCYFAGALYNNTQFLPNLVWDVIDEKYKTPAQLEKEAKEDYFESLKEDDSIIEFEGRTFSANPVSKTDILMINEINKMLETDARCYQGADGTNTAGIQNERNFPVPTRTIQKFNADGTTYNKIVLDLRATVTNEDLKSYLGVIEKYKRECAAQQMLDSDQGGILSSVDKLFAYCDDIPNTSEDFDPFCGKVYADHSVIASNVPIWTQERLNEQQNRDVEHHVWNIYDDICLGYYTNTYKQLFEECQPEYVATGSFQSMEIYSEAEEKMKQFKKDGGLTMLKELQQAKLEAEMAQINKQLRELGNQ